jgi:hypothetical protein
MTDELIAQQCCPTFFKATRVDNSCFRQAEAYIATDVFTSISDPDRKFVRFGTDNDSRDLCWEVDRNFQFNSVPNGATIITGLTAADDIKDSADKILLENANQDDKIYMIIAACRRSDYDVILKGGSGPDYLVNDSTKLAAFQKRFGSFPTAVGGNCIKPRQQFFAVNVRSATIDGSADHQNSFDAGTPGNATPIAVGKFIKLSGNTVNAAGSLTAGYNTTAIGNNAEESALIGVSITNEIFKVIDVKRQTIPGISSTSGSVIYPYDITAYIESATITSLNANCSDCLQAYLDYESQSDATSATLDTIIPFGSAGDTYIDLLNKAPTLWPCRVNINRVFNVSTVDATLPSGRRERIISRLEQGAIEQATEANTTFDAINCSPDTGPILSPTQVEIDTTTAPPVPLQSFQFGYDTTVEGNQPFGVSIFNAHRGNGGGTFTNVTINTEYTKNLRMVRNIAESTGSCGDHVRVETLTDTAGVSTTFDYLLNSANITVSLPSDSIVNDIPTLAIFPTAENEVLNRNIIPGWLDSQSTRCFGPNSCPDASNEVRPNGYDWTDRPRVTGEFAANTPNIGLDATNKVYNGRIGMTTTSGDLIPMLRYSRFYCHTNESDQVNTIPGLDHLPTQNIINNDTSRFGNIDLVVPLTPQVEIAAGFNVNGFKPAEQRTNTIEGRPDSVTDPTDGSKKCFPGKSHQAKFTFGSEGADGTTLTSLPFFLTSYAVGNGSSYKYVDGEARSISANTVQRIRDFETEKKCGNELQIAPINPSFSDSSVESAGLGIPEEPESNKHTPCPLGELPCDYFGGDYSRCRDIHILTNPSFLAFFIGNNKYTKFDGTTDDTLFNDENFLYAGNGRNYAGGHLSGDAYEFVTANGTVGVRTNDSRIGVDTEWSSVFIEAQDPFARGCTDCLRTYEGADDNYELMTDKPSSLASSFSNPHTI